METVVLVVMIAGALAAVMVPLVRGRRDAAPGDDAAIEAEIARYRDALRAGTVCGRCKRANHPAARYCTECGRGLPSLRRVGAPDSPTA